jgi:hypothetical protein
LSAGPKVPPEFAWPQILVRGDVATTEYLLALADAVPVKGPVIKINVFSGPKGFTPPGTSSYRYLVARPAPPIKSLAHSSFIFSSEIVPSDKLTLKILPIKAYSIILPPLDHIALKLLDSIKNLSTKYHWPAFNNCHSKITELHLKYQGCYFAYSKIESIH